MTQLLLIVSIGGSRVAFPSTAIESVVELDTLIPVPRAAPHVAGLSALRSRVLTVIDTMRSLDLGTTDCSDGIREAAVVELDGHHYALIVDSVEDVVEAMYDPVRYGSDWRGWNARLGHGRAEDGRCVVDFRRLRGPRIRRPRDEIGLKPWSFAFKTTLN